MNEPLTERILSAALVVIAINALISFCMMRKAERRVVWQNVDFDLAIVYEQPTKSPDGRPIYVPGYVVAGR